MRQATTAGLTVLALALLGTAAVALTAHDGYVAAPVFALSDAPPSMAYPTGFTGVPWDEMDRFALGPGRRTAGVGEEAALAVAQDGRIFALVYGYEGSDFFTGVIAYDGGSYDHVAQDAMVDAGVPEGWRAGGNMRAIVACPSTVGLLTQGHVLVVRTWRDEAVYVPGGDSGETWLELLDIDPDTGDRTLVHSWPSTVNANARLAVDADGTIYALQTGILDAAGDPTGPEIRKLVWNGSAYDDSLLIRDVEGGVLLGPDGYVYTFADHAGFGWSYASGTEPEILRVHPDTGAASSYADVDGWSFIYDWAFDTSGALRIALDSGRKQTVSTVTPGRTASTKRGAIANWAMDFVNLTPTGQDGLYVAEALAYGDADISRLDPDTSGGSGGGKGGGRGKK